METRHFGIWERYAWVAGILFVIALVAEVVVAIGIPASQVDSAAKIAQALHTHQHRLGAIASLSVVYAPMFLIYLSGLYTLLHMDTARARALGSLVLLGGTLLVTLHAVSDIGITGLVGAKLVGAFGPHHDPSVVYTLYLLTFALDSVGDIFGQSLCCCHGPARDRERGPAALARLDGDARRHPVVPSGLFPRRRYRHVRGARR
ncbi:MAG: hypothetical protein DLM70_17655 [Chloroflexi bacterium]|nr:MAG: hypothetical protein DLM70_17655 [Chloroflexota bacterium]